MNIPNTSIHKDAMIQIEQLIRQLNDAEILVIHQALLEYRREKGLVKRMRRQNFDSRPF